MLTRLLLASASILALGGFAAAADLTPTPPPVPAFTWAGLYLGGQIGFAWANDTGYVSNTGPISGPIGPVTGTFATTVVPVGTFSSVANPSGVIGGAHLGYTWQVNQWVLGLEGEIDGVGLSKTISPVYYVSSTTNSYLQGALLGRAGYAFDHILVYVTGGGVEALIKNSYNVVSNFSALPDTRKGWTVGGGIEYAVNNNWSVRAEYRYSNFGVFFDPWVVDFVSVSHHWTENQVKVGFSYKFGSAPPPVAVVTK